MDTIFHHDDDDDDDDDDDRHHSETRPQSICDPLNDSCGAVSARWDVASGKNWTMRLLLTSWLPPSE